MIERNQVTPKICFLIEKVGPYHAYRLEQIQHLHPICIETRPGSERYPWKETQSSELQDAVFQLKENSSKALYSLLNYHKPDVLFVTGYGFKEMLWGMAWAVMNNVPIVMQTDSTVLDEPRNFLKEWIKRRLVSNCTAALVAGIRSREYIVELGMKPVAVFAPYDVVDNDFYASNSLTIKHKRPYLVCVSRLIPQKNLFFLIEVFKEISKSNDIDLIILGNGPLEAELKKFVDKKQLNDRIHFKGFLHKDEVKAYYHHAKALVLASTSEPWGLCVNEAMATGLPILISENCGAAIDLVIDGKNGFKFSPTQISMAVEKFTHFLEIDAAELKIMNNASKKIIESYSGKSYLTAINQSIFYCLKKPNTTFFNSAAAMFIHLVSRKIN